MLHNDLLQQARQLATLDSKKPKQANLRRAISSAYYALFHFLIHETCCVIMGTQHDEAAYRHVLGRAFNHGPMNNACKSFLGGTLTNNILRGLPEGFIISEEIRYVAQSFHESQEKRHLADYDLTEKFSRSDALALIEQIESAIEKFSMEDDLSLKHFFLACLLTWNTLSKRK